MSLSTLDLKTALIVIDLQKGTVSLLLVHTVTEVVSNARALADAFRSHAQGPKGQSKPCRLRPLGASFIMIRTASKPLHPAGSRGRARRRPVLE